MKSGGHTGVGRRRAVWLAWLLPLAVMAPVALIVGAGGFDGLYGQDPFGYYNYAVGPLRESLRAGQPWLPFFWPPGYPLLVVGATALVGVRPLAGQWVAWVMGGLVPVCTYALARELTRDEAGGGARPGEASTRGGERNGESEWRALRAYGVPLAAGLLAALCGQLWQSSAVVMADTTGLAAATLGAWAVARYGRQRAVGGRQGEGWKADEGRRMTEDGSQYETKEHGAQHGELVGRSWQRADSRWPLADGGWLVAASAAFGGAILARWIYGLVAVPCVVYVLIVIGRRLRAEAEVPTAGRQLAHSADAPPLRGAKFAPEGPAPPTAPGVMTAGRPGGPKRTESGRPEAGRDRAGSDSARSPWTRSVRLGRVLGPVLAAGLVGMVVLWPVAGPALEVALGRSAGLASFAGNLQGRGWAPANALRREFDTADGRLSYSLPNGLYYALAPAHRYYFTPLLAPFIAVGLGRVARRRRLAQGLLVAGWAAVVLAYHAGDPWQNFRFTLAYLPPLAILTALGLEAAGEWGAQRWRWGRVAALGWLTLGLVAMAAGGAVLTQSFVARKAEQLELVRAVEAAVPADSRLIAFGLTLTLRHYSALETEELYYLEISDLARMAAEVERPLYLLANPAEVEGQWRDMPLGESYRWLRDGPGLRAVGEWQGYTLWEVGE